MPSPWLTVVTVVKDDPDGLAHTMTSIAAQDRTGVEVLIIDSSADRQAAPALLADADIDGQVLWCEPAGIYPAMNLGVQEASGTYLHFLNSGDAFDGPDVLTALRTSIEASSPTWLYGPVRIVSADGSSVVTPPWDFAAEQAAAFSRGHFPPHQGTVARTEVVRDLGGFDPQYRIVADYALFLRLAQIAPPVVADPVIARFHEGGISTVRWARAASEFHRARRAILAPTGAAARRERSHTAVGFVRAAAYRSPWPLAGGLALLMWLALGLTGVGWGAGLALTGIVAAQGLGGALWWRLLQPRRCVPVLEAVGAGLGLGTAAAMLTGLIGAWWLAPLLALAAWALVRRRLAPLGPLARPEVLALAVGMVPGLAAFALAIRAYPLSWLGTWSGYHGDMPFFEALSVSVARLGPGASIFMSGADLRYHSLAYGWAGELTMAVDAAPFAVLTRVLPLVTLIGVIAIAGAWTRRLTRTWWAPSLAVALVVVGGFVGATYGSVLNFDSPSQSMSAMWLLAFSMLLVQVVAVRPAGSSADVSAGSSVTRSGGWSFGWSFGWLLAIAVLVIALTGGKVSAVAVAGTGLGVLLIAGVARREAWRWQAIAAAIVAAIAFGATYLLLLAGSANAGGLALFGLLDRASSVQGLNPIITPRGIAAGIVILVIATLPRWAGLAWLVGARSTRWHPATSYGLGLAIGGVLSLIALSGGFNDLWFAVAASAPLAVLSAWGVAQAADWLGPRARTRARAAALLGILAALVAAALWTTGSTGVLGNGWRWSGPIVAVIIVLAGAAVLARRIPGARLPAALALAVIGLVLAALPSRIIFAAAEPFAQEQEGSRSTVLFTEQLDFIPIVDRNQVLGWSDTQATAGAWLRANASSDDLVATNMTLGAIVPALTRLTTFVSNTHIQAPYGSTADLPVVQVRERQSWDFIERPSASTMAPLCEAGVDWLWVEPSRTKARSWEPFATVALEEPDVIVLRVNPSACS